MRWRPPIAGARNSSAAISSAWKSSNMTWDFLLGRAAERSFRSMPTRDRQRINTALSRMKDDPSREM
jgi:hypothetical protein